MPKLRNADTDIGKFTQWLGRKCRNHNPLHELKMPERERASLPNTHTKGKNQGGVFTTNGRDDQVVYRAGGRTFVIEVKEVPDDQVGPTTAIGS